MNLNHLTELDTDLDAHMDLQATDMSDEQKANYAVEIESLAIKLYNLEDENVQRSVSKVN